MGEVCDDDNPTYADSCAPRHRGGRRLDRARQLPHRRHAEDHEGQGRVPRTDSHAVYWVNNSADSYPPQIAAKARAAAAAHQSMFKSALRIGVPIAFGTDAGVYPHGMNAMEFGLMTDLGMSPAAALLAGTRDAAKLLGVEADVGTLEAGKTADIVGVPGNVLSDIHATEHPIFVMHLGRVVVQRP